MLLSAKKDECDCAYESAAIFLASDPRKLRKLDDIYGNPSYYCGYIIRVIRGNLNAKGSVPSEQIMPLHCCIFWKS